MAFHVHHSNRAERLVEALAAIVRDPLADPLARERIIVQGKGMERWLSMQLADRLGVWAHPGFDFPRHFVNDAFTAVLGDAGAVSPAFEPEAMKWSLAELLLRCESESGFDQVRVYLAGEERERKLLQLAERLARAFDEYLVYRPRMVLEWPRHQPHWQAALWRRLVERHGDRHLAAVAADMVARLHEPAVDLGRLPPRVGVFGVSTLAPLYLDFFLALAATLDVHLFLLNPSEEYWAAIQTPGDIRRALERSRAAAAEDLHLEVGHPLLSSLGRLGRDFLYRVVEAGPRDHDAFEDPGTDTMLHALQADILRLRPRGAARPETAGAGPGEPPLPLAADDVSIQVHSCHGPMREVEVLHDRLLDLFGRETDLEARDVVVLSPSIAAYAPFIDAVFGARVEPRIPYRISDRGVRTSGQLLDAFLSVLEVLRGRLAAPDVVDLLAHPPVTERFGFDDDAVEHIRTWVAESGIRWGADARHRAEEGQPPIAANTWRFGLERLLLGYAMEGEERSTYGGVLPYDGVEGADAGVLGSFAELCETLLELRARVRQPLPMDDWVAVLADVLRRVLAAGDAVARERQAIATAIENLGARCRAGGFAVPVELAEVIREIEAELDRGRPATGFLGGGVTFCELVPMRSIPFRVVCLLGMNDADFPRVRRRPGFDLIAAAPEPGDRSSRDDDRYLFLEALLSARDYLIVTCTGQSIRDSSRLPPSVVVSELLDTLERSFARPGGSVAEQVVVRHPLQPFSPENFGARGDPRLFSYAAAHGDGARALLAARHPAPLFAAGPLPAAAAVLDAVDLDALVRFFKHPSRAFLAHLGIHLGRDTIVLAEREPTELDSLEKWELGDDLLARRLRGESLAEVLPVVRAAGVLPPGMPGDGRFAAAASAVEGIVRRGGPVILPPPAPVEISLPDLGLTGLVRGVGPDGLVRRLFSNLSAKYLLELWVCHLALNAQGNDTASTLVARDKTARFAPVADARAFLAELIGLYRAGLATPLPLFPDASHAFAAKLRKTEDENAALAAARTVFDPEYDRHGTADANDEYVVQLYRTTDPLAPLPGAGLSFASVAQTVFMPLLRAMGGK